MSFAPGSPTPVTWIDRRWRAMVAAMGYRLSRRESIHQAARRIADHELGAALGALRDPGDPHPRVHSARKAIKRVRALLRLVRAGLGSEFERANRDLRDAARRLASRRDAAVAADVFTRLVPAPTPSLAAVAVVLAAARDDAVADDAALAAAADDLARVRARIAEWPALTGDWSAIRPGFRASYRDGRKAMRAAFARPSPAAFHAWRRRVKDIWYHTLLLLGVWKPVQTAWARALEDLSDTLGDDHDLEVLRVALAAHPDLDPDARAQILARADARSEELRAVAWALGERLHAERPARHIARIRRYWRTWRAEAHAPVAPPAAPRSVVMACDPEVICPGEPDLSYLSLETGTNLDPSARA